MGKHAFHVVREKQGWAVRTGMSGAASSVHRTQAEATDAARRTALRVGGGDVVVHRADGRLKDARTYEPDPAPAPRRRSVRPAGDDGLRTTLRVPESLIESADRLAAELGVSRNDALLRLAARGAQLYEQDRLIAERREARRAAIFADADGGAVDDLPSPEEMRAAVLADRGGPTE